MSTNEAVAVTPGPRPAAGVRRRRGRSRRGNQIRGLLLIAPALVLIGVFFLLPLGVAIWMSFNSWPLLGSHHFTGLSNYQALLHDAQVGHALLFTLEFAAIVTPLLFVGGLFLATLMQHERRGVSLFRTAIFAPVAIGFASASYLWLALTDPSTGELDRVLVDLHLTGQAVDWLDRPALALLLVIMVTLWKQAGFSMIVLMNGLQGIPNEVEEAARVEGAGRFRLLWSIKLPMMKESIAFTLTFVAIACFLTFDQFYILTSGGPSSSTVTAVYRIYNTAFTQQDLGYASAISMAFLVLLLIITGTQLFLLRRRYDE